MSQNSIQDRVETVFHDTFDDTSIKIRRELTAAHLESWDSLNHVRLIVALEREFGIEFSSSEIERLDDVGRLLDLIEAKCAA
jgi:acyl carrier protein